MAKRASIAILALCQVMAMALWFSASAVVPQLVAEFRLSGFMQSALTSGVQLGFVAGCLVSAFLGLADRLELRRFFAGSALLGASANALLLVVDPSSAWMPLMRFVSAIANRGKEHESSRWMSRLCRRVRRAGLGTVRRTDARA